MNETIKVLLTRCSTKSYTDRQVEDTVLDTILEAGLYAPSGMNRQGTVMVAVRDKATRDLLAKLNTEIRGADSDMFYGAPCVIVVLADPAHNTWVEDGSLVMGNLLTAAHALGVSACWVHRARETFDRPEGKELLRAWGLPETLRGVGNCILGYADKQPQPKTRKENRIVKV